MLNGKNTISINTKISLGEMHYFHPKCNELLLIYLFQVTFKERFQGLIKAYGLRIDTLLSNEP